jgi:hypothetical protein
VGVFGLDAESVVCDSAHSEEGGRAAVGDEEDVRRVRRIRICGIWCAGLSKWRVVEKLSAAIMKVL